MPVVKLDVKELERLLGKKVKRDDLARDIPQIGADVEKADGDEWAVEFFPNRPDLFTVEGVARAMRAWYGVDPGLASYKVAPAKTAVHVDAAVAEVRPHIAAAFVRNVTISQSRLDGLIQLQEDLHWGLGARRRKVAIGVHDAAPLKPPFYYTTVAPDGVAFVPLGASQRADSPDASAKPSGVVAETRAMTPREILTAHAKGKEYAHLLEKADRYPLIVDAEGRVASMPPIINGALTAVTTRTRDLFLDVTGTDAWAVEKALNIIATALAESGGKVEAVRRLQLAGRAPAIHATSAERLDFLREWRKDRKAWTALKTTPDFSPEKRVVRQSEVARLLGEDMSAKQIADTLKRMGHGAVPKAKKVEVKVPCYRIDIMHEWDLVEDVAVGHGITRFAHSGPRAATVGKPLPGVVLADKARASLVGLGFLEIVSLSLSNPADQFEKMGLARGWSVDMRNALSEEHSILRVSVLPSLLQILKKNAHRDLPQRFFEVGVVTVEGPRGQARPERRVAGVVASSRAGFSEAKGVVLALARDLGWKAEPVAKAEHGGFVSGRAAALPNVAGVFGEVHPRTLEAFGLAHPCVAFEFTLGKAAEGTLAGDPAEWRLG